MKKLLINKNLLAVIVMLIGIGLIVIGLLSGDAVSVLNKARRICMECIGIG
ncbi:MAG: hypothetical protein J6Y58_03810 [Clostridiales bacterium]|nr:hypothetical protein [Clostridiales bacterium]